MQTRLATSIDGYFLRLILVFDCAYSDGTKFHDHQMEREKVINKPQAINQNFIFFVSDHLKTTRSKRQFGNGQNNSWRGTKNTQM